MTKFLEWCGAVCRATAADLFNEGKVKVIRSSNAEVDNIHLGANGVIESIQKP